MVYTFHELFTLRRQLFLVLIVQSIIDIQQERLTLLYHALPADRVFLPVIYTMVEQNTAFSRWVQRVMERLFALLGFVNAKQTQSD